MHTIDKTEDVKKQYANDKNLSARIGLHAKYSTNQEGFPNWLFKKYDFSGAARILELGCGNGAQWEGHLDRIPPDCLLVLTDLSDGMVGRVWEKFGSPSRVLAQTADIQSLPFPGECFDAVIANHMLYHVPNLPQAISEVRRVLKSGGTFYAATNGNGGIRAFLRSAFRQVDPTQNVFSEGLSFSLQNGSGVLRPYFSHVRRTDYEDSLRVTVTEDLMEWIRSTMAAKSLDEKSFQRLTGYFEEIRKKEGAILIPKEAGLFRSVK